MADSKMYWIVTLSKSHFEIQELTSTVFQVQKFERNSEKKSDAQNVFNLAWDEIHIYWERHAIKAMQMTIIMMSCTSLCCPRAKCHWFQDCTWHLIQLKHWFLRYCCTGGDVLAILCMYSYANPKHQWACNFKVLQMFQNKLKDICHGCWGMPHRTRLDVELTVNDGKVAKLLRSTAISRSHRVKNYSWWRLILWASQTECQSPTQSFKKSKIYQILKASLC